MRYDDQHSVSYRADIDGLRAIAVIAVILGHAFEGWLPGGYLGVDVFFVISGFVITGSLLARPETRFSPFIAGFFLRRIKRLLPALLVCVAVTGGVLLFIDAAPRISLVTGASALVGASNITLYFQQLDYFAHSIRYNAFAHTWSLGVEEQFYLLYPLLVWMFLPMIRRHSAQILTTLMIVSSLASLAAFAMLQDTRPMLAYYMMPMRFWELGCGVVAALVLPRAPQKAWPWVPGFVPPVLLAGAVAVFVFPSGMRVPDHLLIVVLTTGLILLGARPGLRSSLLTNGVSTYLGRISYSLYLWHWPFLTFALLTRNDAPADLALATLLALGVSILSYHIVEQPVRRMSTPIPAMRHFGGAAVSVLGVCAVLAGTFGLSTWFPKASGADAVQAALRPHFLPLPESGLPFNPTCVVDNQDRALRADTVSDCTFAPVQGGDGRVVWALGDSHAGHLQGALVRLREEYGFGFHLVETVGQIYPSQHAQPSASRQAMMAQIKAQWKPGDIVLLSRVYLYRSDPATLLHDVPGWLDKVEVLVAQLEEEGIKVLLVGPPPMFAFEDIRACDPADPRSCTVERVHLDQVIGPLHGAMNDLAGRHRNVGVLEIFPLLCPKTSAVCHPATSGVFMFRDRDHLNTEGAVLVVGELEKVLETLR